MFLSSLVAACGQKSSHAVSIPEVEIYRLQPGELVLAATEEDIPPILAEEENFVPAEKADLDDLDLIVGVFISGKSKAYPVRLLSLHEVINDQIDGFAFAVTWCPLCYSAVVFNRMVDGVDLSFRASGYLLHDNLVMVDHPTETLWSQLLGQGIKGAQRGTVLEVYPSTITTWGVWYENYPTTAVLSADSLGYKEGLPDPYAGYFISGAVGLSSSAQLDQRLPGKSLVMGVSLGDLSKAYPEEVLQEKKLIQDKLGSTLFLAVFDDKQERPIFYLRTVDGEELDFNLSEAGNLLIDNQSSSEWEISSGKAVAGPRKGQSLTRLPGQQTYWFA